MVEGVTPLRMFWARCQRVGRLAIRPRAAELSARRVFCHWTQGLRKSVVWFIGFLLSSFVVTVHAGSCSRPRWNCDGRPISRLQPVATDLQHGPKAVSP